MCDKVVCERWCVTKWCERWCVKDGVKDGVCVTKMVCERGCVKDGVSKMVGDNVVCERRCVTKRCVKDGMAKDGL